MDDPAKHLRRGFNWLGSATVITKVIDFTTTLVVLMFLTKAQMGVAALIISIGAVVEAANGLGTNEALIQAQSVSRQQLDSIFWFILGETVLLGLLLMIAGPFIGAIYDIQGLWAYLGVMALKQPIVGVAIVPMAMLNRDLQYERLAMISTGSTLAAALTRLGLAMAGAGTWALVIGNASSGLYTLLGTWIAKPYRPGWRFDRASAEPLIRFGISSSVSGTLQQLYRNVDYLLIGWFYGPSQLAVYRLAFDIAMEPAVAVGTLISRTVFPVLTKVAAMKEQLTHALSWSLGRLIVLVAPLSFAMILIADPLTALIHDRQGLSYAAAAWPLKILAVAALLRVTFQLVYPLILVSGRPSIAVMVSALTLTLLGGGILITGFSFQGEAGLIAASVVWLVIYPFLMLWAANYVRHRWEIRVGALLRAFLLPGVAIALMLIAHQAVCWFAGAVAPPVSTGLVIAVTVLTYGGLFLYTRSRPEGAA